MTAPVQGVDLKEQEAQRAMQLRAEWMRSQGLPLEVIAHFCDPALYPANLEEEQKNVQAMAELAALNLTSNQEIGALAAKCVARSTAADELRRALTLRANSMSRAGIPPEEIARYCDPNQYPADLAEEEANVREQEKLEKRRHLTQAELDQLAAKSPPPSEWTYE